MARCGGSDTFSAISLTEKPWEKLDEKITERKTIHLVHPANSLVMNKLDGVSVIVQDKTRNLSRNFINQPIICLYAVRVDTTSSCP